MFNLLIPMIISLIGIPVAAIVLDVLLSDSSNDNDIDSTHSKPSAKVIMKKRAF